MMSLFQHGMSLDMGACFQRGMSLRGSVWVDHERHGDRHERDATVYAGADQAFLEGTAEVGFQPIGGDEGGMGTSRPCSSALPTLGSSGRTRGSCCAIWGGPPAIRGNS